MPLPLIPGKLRPTELLYPADLQALVNRLASNLFTPEQPRDFYKHNSPDQAPGDALWLDTRNGALKAQDAGRWANVLAGNTGWVCSAENGSVPAGAPKVSPSEWPSTTMGVEVTRLEFAPAAAQNRVLLFAHLPAVAASRSDVTVYGLLTAPSGPVAMSTVTVRYGALQGLIVLGVHAPGASDVVSGSIVYTLRVGTDDHDVTIYYNRLNSTDAFSDFMRASIIAMEIPV
jgi:hypothetical protein